MLGELLRHAHRLDAWLRFSIGRPYHAILGVGLVIEIARHIRELGEVGHSASGIVRIALQLLLYSVLLIHQLGELHSHLAGRRRER